MPDPPLSPMISMVMIVGISLPVSAEVEEEEFMIQSYLILMNKYQTTDVSKTYTTTLSW
jgi:hypothetical protein